MTGTFKTALGVSLGIHSGMFLGWPTTNPVQFDVERAPTSLEIRLVAPRETRSIPTATAEPSIVEAPPETTADAVQEPDPVPQTIVTPEVHGALREVLPSYLRNPAPRYPLLARQRGEEGTVVVKAQVLPTGRCGRLEVQSSSGSALLDASATHAVRQWQFQPAKRGGAPVALWVEIPITFELIDAGGP